MTAYTQIIEALSDLVHESWMAGQRAKGRTTAKSRHEGGSPELMVPYTDLRPVDQDDDRRIVATVILGLTVLPVVDVLRLLTDVHGDDAVRARLRELALVDPVPDSLADGCLDAVTTEGGRP